MIRSTIKWRIFKFNIIIITMLIVLVMIIFNIAGRWYLEKDILSQLHVIASSIENVALQQENQLALDHRNNLVAKGDEELLFRYYSQLNRSLREPMSVLNANYIFLDIDMNTISIFAEDSSLPANLVERLVAKVNESATLKREKIVNITLAGNEYIAIIKPVQPKNTFGLRWIIIYSNLNKIIEMQWKINIILFVILLLCAIITMIFSSMVSKKIAAPFSAVNEHIRAIAERNFGRKINLDVDDEFRELVNNINLMSDKLNSHDMAQKIFLQNASHEFRTPLMSIQSYAEGLKYGVVDSDTAAGVIIDESKRMANLVEEILYLSRLDAIEENYNFTVIDFNELVKSCVKYMSGIAMKENIKIDVEASSEKIEIYADEEKISRAVTNIISNCIRFAESTVKIEYAIKENKMLEINISDDGPGFDENDLPNIFNRFYKGKKGKFGLGLAISKSIVEKHKGEITAKNLPKGALFTILLPLGR